MKYRTIVADPPWHYEGFAGYQGTKGTDNWRRVEKKMPYPAMTLDEIRALPVRGLALADARLFLWTTNRYLPTAFSVLDAWMFTYKQTLVWHKTGRPFPFGGSVAPNHAEFLLVATVGSPERIGRIDSSVVAVKRPHRHSAKPECFVDYIESCSPGPYLELFARRDRLGWDTWGTESLGTAEVAA